MPCFSSVFCRRFEFGLQPTAVFFFEHSGLMRAHAKAISVLPTEIMSARPPLNVHNLPSCEGGPMGVVGFCWCVGAILAR